MGCAASRKCSLKLKSLSNRSVPNTKLVLVAPVKCVEMPAFTPNVNIQEETRDVGEEERVKSFPSTDSGFGDADFAITEDSDHRLVREVEQQFQQVLDLDLTVIGQCCPRVLSPSEQHRLEEARIKQRLKEEGLLTSPVTGTPGGLSYEVSCAEAKSRMSLRLPPLTSAKTWQDKRPDRVSTKEMLIQKQDDAEERRKQYVERRTAIADRDERTLKTAAAAIEKFKQQVSEKTNRKMLTSAANREMRVSRLKERLRVSHERGIEVRLKKILQTQNPSLDVQFLQT